MRHLALLAALALPLAAGPALAQAPSPVFPGPGTLLRLSESAEVTRNPDEVGATLRFEARAATAAEAQAAVNRAMTAALETARAASGIVTSTGAYSTYRQEDPARWVSSQTLSLRGAEQAPILELAGTLQARGFAMGGIRHGLKRDTARTARQEAAALALTALRRRADAVAEGLGMRVERIAEVALEVPDMPMPPMPAPMMASARAAPPPVAQAEEQVVSATVQAQVVMVPR